MARPIPTIAPLDRPARQACHLARRAPHRVVRVSPLLLMVLGLLFSSSAHSMSAAQRAPNVIVLPGDRFFPEGVTVSKDGTFYVGSMEEGSIVRVRTGARESEPFIAAGANGLVSVLGVYADDARGLLWVCSSDAGNGKLTGTAPAGIKAFDLKTGAAQGSWDLPGGGFCNDLTVDPQGNVYASDSWVPRILRLPAGGDRLEEWINDPQLGSEQWSLNGLDIDAANHVLYVVNQRAGKLFRIAVGADGRAGAVTQISTSQELRRPDGLKLVAPGTLATAEGGSGGVALIKLSGDSGEVTRVSEGLNGVATFAFWNNSAWIVENQGQHFWEPDTYGRDAKPPFRLVEVPLSLGSNLGPASPAQPTGAPSALPKTGGAAYPPLLALGTAALVFLLGGLLVRCARQV